MLPEDKFLLSYSKITLLLPFMARNILQIGAPDRSFQNLFLCFSLQFKAEREDGAKGMILQTEYHSTLNSVPQEQQDVINIYMAEHLYGGPQENHRQTPTFQQLCPHKEASPTL